LSEGKVLGDIFAQEAGRVRDISQGEFSWTFSASVGFQGEAIGPTPNLEAKNFLSFSF
jgi:hypothetical protein